MLECKPNINNVYHARMNKFLVKSEQRAHRQTTIMRTVVIVQVYGLVDKKIQSIDTKKAKHIRGLD